MVIIYRRATEEWLQQVGFLPATIMLQMTVKQKGETHSAFSLPTQQPRARQQATVDIHYDGELAV